MGGKRGKIYFRDFYYCMNKLHSNLKIFHCAFIFLLYPYSPHHIMKEDPHVASFLAVGQEGLSIPHQGPGYVPHHPAHALRAPGTRTLSSTGLCAVVYQGPGLSKGPASCIFNQWQGENSACITNRV